MEAGGSLLSGCYLRNWFGMGNTSFCTIGKPELLACALAAGDDVSQVESAAVTVGQVVGEIHRPAAGGVFAAPSACIIPANIRRQLSLHLAPRSSTKLLPIYLPPTYLSYTGRVVPVVLLMFTYLPTYLCMP